MSAAAARHLAPFGAELGLPGGMERFTDDVRRAVIVARDLAKELGHAVVGTEHLLVGTLAGEWPTVQAFGRLGLTEAAIRRKVERARPRGKTPIPAGTHVPFSHHAKSVMMLAMREALQMGMNRIDPGHVLLALIRHGEGTAVSGLDEMGIDLAELRSAVVEAVQAVVITEGPAEDQPPSEADAAGGGEPR